MQPCQNPRLHNCGANMKQRKCMVRPTGATRTQHSTRASVSTPCPSPATAAILTRELVAVTGVGGEVAAATVERLVLAGETPVEVLPEDGLRRLGTRPVEQLQLVQHNALVFQHLLLAARRGQGSGRVRFHSDFKLFLTSGRRPGM